MSLPEALAADTANNATDRFINKRFKFMCNKHHAIVYKSSGFFLYEQECGGFMAFMQSNVCFVVSQTLNRLWNLFVISRKA